jgi:hypothetical protein
MASILRKIEALLTVGFVFGLIGCMSIPTTSTKPNVSPNVPSTTPEGFRVLSRSDMDHVIDVKLSRQDAASFLKNIRIDDYDLQDPNTNWSHADYDDGNNGYAIYYFTYRQTFFILFLKDAKDRISSCIDIIIMKRPSADYELGMGQVEINRDHIDGQVVVVYNKNWKGNYSDDIVAAYKPNLETKQIETVRYDYIRIYRDQ